MRQKINPSSTEEMWNPAPVACSEQFLRGTYYCIGLGTVLYRLLGSEEADSGGFVLMLEMSSAFGSRAGNTFSLATNTESSAFHRKHE